MIYAVARWLMRQVGLVPIAEAVKNREFENTLAMLYPTEEDLDQFREGVILLAQAGVSYEGMERAARILALGYDPDRQS